MKAVYIVIVLVIVVAAASGAYIWATRSQPGSPGRGAQSGQAVSAEALKNLEDLTESRFTRLEDRIRGLEILIGRLGKETADLRRSPEGVPAESPEAPPAEQQDVARDPLREEVRRHVEEQKKQGRERMFEETLLRFVEHPRRRVERIIDRREWDEQKKQSVMVIVAEHQEEVKRLIEAARTAPPTGPGEREALTERIRQVNAWTMDKLRAILTPEEAQEVERVFGQSRRMGESVPESPPSGENTPMQPEPWSEE